MFVSVEKGQQKHQIVKWCLQVLKEKEGVQG